MQYDLVLVLVDNEMEEEDPFKSVYDIYFVYDYVLSASYVYIFNWLSNKWLI